MIVIQDMIVNITKLKDDIKTSVEAPLDGYIARLRKESSLLQKFDIAIHEIYDPTVTR